MYRENKESILVWICFFLSASTLLCCTLPILLVMIGLGSLMAVMAAHISWLSTLLAYKFWIFLISGILLLIADFVLRQPGRSCPADPALAKRCAFLTLWNQRILRASLVIWAIGFISAYLAIPIGIWLKVF